MSHRNIIWALLIISASALLFSLYFSGPFLCSDYQWACTEAMAQIRGMSFILSIPLIIIFLVLLYCRVEVIKAWAKFAIPAFLIMVAIMLYTYNNEPGPGGFMNWGTDDQLATVTLPPLFLIISILIIILKSRSIKKTSMGQ